MAHYVLIICFVALAFFFTSHTLTKGADGGIFGSMVNVDTETTEEKSLTKLEMDDNQSRLIVFVNTFSAVMIAVAQVQERTLIETCFCLSIALAGIVCPIVFSWTSGGGWLERLAYID